LILISVELIFAADRNNVRIHAPGDMESIPPANFKTNEHIGNVKRAHAKFLATYMDFGSYSLNCIISDCNQYSEGFVFTCTLLEDTNHTGDGYEVQINICTDNSDEWINSFFDELLRNNLMPMRLR
jgi:hypothetical protein